MIVTRGQLATRLGLTSRQLTWWLWALREDRRYREFEIQRRGGGPPRQIHTPIKPIRDMQAALLPMLESAYEPWPHVHGFVSARSAITNAAIHRGQRWILRIDLKEFFPSINYGRVRGMFMARPFEFVPEVATALAQICCHQRMLPQGAPTSPIISNLICRGLDARLAAYASAAHCSYTRYADDICFSTGRREFPAMILRVVDGRPVLNPDLRTRIEDQGFVINEAKTRLMPRFQRQRVTGVIVNKRLNVPHDYFRQVRAMLHIWEKYGKADAERAFRTSSPITNWPPGKADPDFALVMRGKVQYLGYVRNYDGRYQRLAQALARCDSSFRPTLPSHPQHGQVVFAGEGPSDAKHVFAALHALRQDFTGLHLVEVSHRPPTNDRKLWEWLEAHRDSRNMHPLVGIFDRDSDEYISRVGEAGWKHLGNGVVAMTLAPPHWLADTSKFCIEMLHRPETLHLTDSEDRRIFLREEFDEQGVSGDGRFRMRHPQKSTLVVEDVIRVDDQKSVGLAKVVFAERIYGRIAPFSAVDFEGFRPTLARLWAAVAVAQTACS